MDELTLPAIMKNIARIITFLFLSTYSFAQNKPIVLNSIKIKVKPIKPQSNLCIEKDNQETAIVMEYEVVEKLDRKLYGNKIFTIIPCSDYPAEFSFDNKVWDLEMSENKIYDRDFLIINEELLLKNVGHKKYWEKIRSAKVRVY